MGLMKIIRSLHSPSDPLAKRPAWPNILLAMKLHTLAWLSPSLATINGAPWSRGTARKPGTCAVSGRAYGAGAAVFKPVRSAGDRYLRILADELGPPAEAGEQARRDEKLRLMGGIL